MGEEAFDTADMPSNGSSPTFNTANSDSSDACAEMWTFRCSAKEKLDMYQVSRNFESAVSSWLEVRDLGTLLSGGEPYGEWCTGLPLPKIEGRFMVDSMVGQLSKLKSAGILVLDRV